MFNFASASWLPVEDVLKGKCDLALSCSMEVNLHLGGRQCVKRVRSQVSLLLRELIEFQSEVTLYNLLLHFICIGVLTACMC